MQVQGRQEKLRRQIKKEYGFKNIVGRCKPMQRVFSSIAMVASSNAPILIRGESGTGKGLIASAIHFKSPRKHKPFIKVNCALVPEHILESELFGHIKGAFNGAISNKKGRFEIANGGSIFLNEIGDIPSTLQHKIFQVLQKGEFECIGGCEVKKVDVRIITATNFGLEKVVGENKFRRDLYKCLNVFPIYVPALRERKEDIPLLVDHFLKKHNEENSKNVNISLETIDMMLEYWWPGNMMELESCVERMVVLSRSEKVTKDELPLLIKTKQTLSSKVPFNQ